jgi:hypothetical protein
MYIDPLIIIIKVITMQLKKTRSSFFSHQTNTLFSPLFSIYIHTAPPYTLEKRIMPHRVKRDNNLSGSILIITLIYYNTGPAAAWYHDK